MNKFLKVSLHIFLNIGIWMFVLLFPYLFMDFNRPHPPILENWLEMLLAILFYYLNYFLLIKRYLFGQKYVLFASINFMAIVMSLVLCLEFSDLDHGGKMRKPEFNDDNHPRFEETRIKKAPLDLQISRILFPMLMALGFAIAIKSTLKSKTEETHRKKLENEHLKSEITYLKYQIQPHFFFNTLNNIYALIDNHPENAKNVLHRLSKLMRYILYQTDNQNVALIEEVTFIENYVELMKIRTASNVSITLNKPSFIPGIQIPPLLYIPLVENSFKHGVDPIKPSIITLQFLNTADTLTFIAQNSYFPKDNQDKSGSGIGLENLNKRLEILYPDKSYTFEQSIVDQIHISKLSIPI